ncbi:MAG TPA: hypothetical protein VJU87_03015 [Gemmatimonadaceae bacterium]|nr:hypothetical protein [Gemmatimonadaceae bacterium]
MTWREAVRRRAIGRRGAILTAIAAILWLIGAVVEPRRAAQAYLVAYVTCVTVVLGALAMVMMAHVTAAAWFVVLRRRAEDIVATLPVLAVLFIPVAVAVHQLYPWANPADLAATVATNVRLKQAYLNVPFFIVRAVIYWCCWIALGATLRRASFRQDTRPHPALVRRMYRTSAGGLVLLAFTMSFAAFDWMMSLEPTWYSTVYGVYVFAGGVLAALGLIAISASRAERAGAIPWANADRFHALGKLELTFVLMWAYMGFVQFLIIWIADIPTEAAWYATREHAGWGAMALVLMIGNFALPFVLLLLRAVKRSILAMTALGWWLLVMHYVDMYWLTLPASTPDNPRPSWLDLVAIIALGAGITMYASWRRGSEAAVPLGDPALAESRGYETEDL